MDNDSCLYSKKVIADLLNLSERRIEQLCQQKIIPKAERGKFELVPTVRAYVMYLQQRLSGGGEVIDVAAVKQEKLKAETEEKKAKAEIAAMRAEAMRGQLIDRSEVVQQWTNRVTEVRAALLSLPLEIGFLFADSEHRNMIEERVEGFVEDTIKRYSRDGICTPARSCSVDGEGAEGNAPAKEDNGERVGGQKQGSRQKKQRNARPMEDKEDAISS